MEPLAHASIGIMVKPLAPKAPMWALVAATQVPDLLSFGFMALGLEHGAVTRLDFEHGLQYLSLSSIVWSHGLLMSVVWSVVVAALGMLLFRDRRTSVILGLLVFSHWMLDFIVYRYIPVLLDNSQTIGFGLLTSSSGFIIGILMEIGLISAGIVSYRVSRKRATVPARG